MTDSRRQPSIVERINSRIHDAPIPTEHLLDEAAARIAELEGALDSIIETQVTLGVSPVGFAIMHDIARAALSHAVPVARDGEQK